MIDSYFLSDDADKMADFCVRFSNVIGPKSGQAAQEESILNDGTVLATSPAIGDPTKLYVCIRAQEAPNPSEGIEVCDSATGLAVVGIWA